MTELQEISKEEADQMLQKEDSQTTSGFYSA
jgi:hypothetical protein